MTAVTEPHFMAVPINDFGYGLNLMDRHRHMDTKTITEQRKKNVAVTRKNKLILGCDIYLRSHL